MVPQANAPVSSPGSARSFADAIILWVALRGTESFLLLAQHALRRFAPPLSLGNLLIVCAPVIISLYNIVFWWLRGQTPGKWLLGLRVVALGGGKVTLGQAVARFAGYLLSALPFYLGFLWILGSERRGFHDRLARTEVVYTRRPLAQAAQLRTNAPWSPDRQSLAA